MAESYKLHRTVEESIYFDAETDEQAKSIADALASGVVSVVGESWMRGDEQVTLLERIEFVNGDVPEDADVIKARHPVQEYEAASA